MAATSPKPVVPVLCAALSPDGRWLVIGTSEKLIVWDMAQGKVSRRFRVGTAQAAFLDDETLATVTFGSPRVYLWNVTTDKYLRAIDGLGGPGGRRTFAAIAPHPSGTLFALASYGDGVIYLELRSKSTDTVLAATTTASMGTSSSYSEVRSLTFAGDGSLLLALFSVGGLKVYRVENNLRTLREDNPRLLPPLAASLVSAFAVAPDGQHIVWGDSNGRVRVSAVWARYPSRPSPPPVFPLQPQEMGHNATVRQIAFSKDGKRLASASEDGVVVIWDTATMRPLHRWSAHSLQVNTVLFSPDGKRLVTAGEEGKVKIWDVQTGKQVRDIPVD